MRRAAANALTGALALTTAAVAALVATAPASATAGPACGDVLTRSTVLHHDLSCPTGDGLVLRGDITLDLHGHRVSGSPGGTGVHATGSSRVVVQGGTLSGWGTALAAVPEDDAAPEEGPVYANAVTARRLTLRDSGTGLHVQGVYFGFDGVSSTADVDRVRFVDDDAALVSGTGGALATVRHSVFSGSGIALDGDDGGTVQVSDSVFTGNDVVGRCTGEFSRCDLTRTVWHRNGAGVTLFGNLSSASLRDSVVDRTRGPVLDASSGPVVLTVDGSTFTRNGTVVSVGETVQVTVTGSTFLRNGTGFLSEVTESPDPDPFFDHQATLTGNRFVRDLDGVRTSDTRTTLTANTALRNRRYGLDAPNATDGGGNVAHGNGLADCVGVAC